MSKKNKIVKLASKIREKGKSFFVKYDGEDITRSNREAKIRSNYGSVEEQKAKKVKKGTKVAEPSSSKINGEINTEKKQVAAPELRSVEFTGYQTEYFYKKKEKTKSKRKKKEVKEQFVEEEVLEVKEEIEVAPVVPIEEPVVEETPVVEEPVVESVVEPTVEPTPAEEEIAAEPVEPTVEETPEEAPEDAVEEIALFEDSEEEDDLSQGISRKNARKRNE
ncbi:MAG: hypothetical protein HUK24_00505, partial [Sphaerochaetaceae bacterium]|nr:hypothetical protein [Sphaerochaetaceae bacterium]